MYGNRWTDEDVAYLREYAHQLPIHQLEQDFQGRHNENSIRIKCHKLRISRARNTDGYTLQGLMDGLELTSERTIYKWMRKKWIKAERRGPDDTTWNFKDADIKHFLQKHPEEIKPEVLQSLWVQDILFDGWGYGMGRLA